MRELFNISFLFIFSVTTFYVNAEVFNSSPVINNSQILTNIDTDNDGIQDNIDKCPSTSGVSTSSDSIDDVLLLQHCILLNDDAIPELFIQMQLSNNFDDTIQPGLLYWLDDNDQQWVYLNFDEVTGLFTYKTTLHPNLANGNYNIRAIRITDKEDNHLRLNEDQLSIMGFDTSYSFSHNNSDNVAPTIESLDSSGWYFNDSGFPSIDFELVLAADTSGVQSNDIIIEMLSPSTDSIQQRPYSFDGENTYLFTIVMDNQFIASGEYPINTIRIKDNAFNYSNSRDFIIANSLTYELNNPNSDDVNSELNELKLTAFLSNELDRPIIFVEGVAFDALSGLRDAYLRLTRPNGSNLDSWLDEESVVGQASTYFSKEIPLPIVYEPGSYSLDFLMLTDYAGNQYRYNSSSVNNVEGDVISQINIFYPDSETSTENTISGANTNDYIFGANRSNDILSGLGGSDYIHSGDGDDIVNAGDGDDTVIGGSGLGDDIYLGGEGNDKLVFMSANTPIEINLEIGKASGTDIGSDVFAGFESFVAGKSADILVSDGADIQLDGYLGNDIFVLQQNETVKGGEGDDEFIIDTIDNNVAINILDYEAGETILLSTALKDITINIVEFSTNLDETVAAISTDGVFYTSSNTESYLIVSEASFKDTITFSNAIALSDINLSKYIILDTDSDGVINYIDSDDDGDMVLDIIDIWPSDSRYVSDSDNDGIPDAWELKYGLDQNDPNDFNSDSDIDGLVAIDEFLNQTSPLLADSDSDTLPDGWEVANNRNPNTTDYSIEAGIYSTGTDDISHVCALDDNGVVCWGGNDSGQTDVPTNLLNPIEVAVGGKHTCAIDDNGIQCWGNNEFGQTEVPSIISQPVAIALGKYHSCAIDANSVFCWGGQYSFETDIPVTITNPVSISSRYKSTCVIDDNGVHCWGASGKIQTEIPEDLQNPKTISVGQSHACALDDNGVRCWGNNWFGQTDVPTNLVNPVLVEVGYFNSCAVDDYGLHCWGTNAYKIHDIPGNLSRVADVAISWKYACALDQAGIHCWGSPDSEQTRLPELAFDPDNDGVDSSIDQLPLDPNEYLDTDGDGIGDNQDLVNDLFNGQHWEVSPRDFNGKIINGVLSAYSRISLSITNRSNQSVKLNSLSIFQSQSDEGIGSTSDAIILGDDGRLSPNESFGMSLTVRNSQEFPFKWRLNFVNPNTGKNQIFTVVMNLDSEYRNGSISLNAIGSTSDYFNLAKDSDDDGVLDSIDAFPRNPSEHSDSDGDGLGDNYEIANGLDRNNADSDTDGVLDSEDFFPLDSNKSTLLDDNVAPIVTAPRDIYLDATGVLTTVDIGVATVSDNLETLDVEVNNSGPYLSGETILTWRAVDSAGNEGTAKQSIFIRPFVNISSLAKVIKQNSLSFTVNLSGNAITYPVLIPITIDADGVTPSNEELEITSGTSAIFGIDLAEIFMDTSFDIKFGQPSNAYLIQNEMQVMFLEGANLPPYELLSQPEPDFTLLTPTAKIIVTSSDGENFFDVARYVKEVSMVGQTVLISGSNDIDSFMVMPGVKYDLTNLKGSVDKLYMSGSLEEYADSILLDEDTGTMQLSRLTDIGNEVVQFIATNAASDLVVFTDGAISAALIKEAILNGNSLMDLTLDTTLTTSDAKTATGAQVKHIVLDSDGAGVMGLGPNITLLISGSSGVDQIYVPEGSVVDAWNLKSGQDEVYVQGELADYDKAFDVSGNIVLTREVIIDTETYTESITVANGGNVATNDLVIFADQQLDTSSIKLQL